MANIQVILGHLSRPILRFDVCRHLVLVYLPSICAGLSEAAATEQVDTGSAVDAVEEKARECGSDGGEVES